MLSLALASTPCRFHFTPFFATPLLLLHAFSRWWPRCRWLYAPRSLPRLHYDAFTFALLSMMPPSILRQPSRRFVTFHWCFRRHAPCWFLLMLLSLIVLAAMLCHDILHCAITPYYAAFYCWWWFYRRWYAELFSLIADYITLRRHWWWCHHFHFISLRCRHFIFRLPLYFSFSSASAIRCIFTCHALMPLFRHADYCWFSYADALRLAAFSPFVSMIVFFSDAFLRCHYYYSRHWCCRDIARLRHALRCRRFRLPMPAWCHSAAAMLIVLRLMFDYAADSRCRHLLPRCLIAAAITLTPWCFLSHADCHWLFIFAAITMMIAFFAGFFFWLYFDAYTLFEIFRYFLLLLLIFRLDWLYCYSSRFSVFAICISSAVCSSFVSFSIWLYLFSDTPPHCFAISFFIIFIDTMFHWYFDWCFWLLPYFRRAFSTVNAFAAPLAATLLPLPPPFICLHFSFRHFRHTLYAHWFAAAFIVFIAAISATLSIVYADYAAAITLTLMPYDYAIMHWYRRISFLLSRHLFWSIRQILLIILIAAANDFHFLLPGWLRYWFSSDGWLRRFDDYFRFHYCRFLPCHWCFIAAAALRHFAPCHFLSPFLSPSPIDIFASWFHYWCAYIYFATYAAIIFRRLRFSPIDYAWLFFYDCRWLMLSPRWHLYYATYCCFIWWYFFWLSPTLYFFAAAIILSIISCLRATLLTLPMPPRATAAFITPPDIYRHFRHFRFSRHFFEMITDYAITPAYYYIWFSSDYACCHASIAFDAMPHAASRLGCCHCLLITLIRAYAADYA